MTELSADLEKEVRLALTTRLIGFSVGMDDAPKFIEADGIRYSVEYSDVEFRNDGEILHGGLTLTPGHIYD